MGGCPGAGPERRWNGERRSLARRPRWSGLRLVSGEEIGEQLVALGDVLELLPERGVADLRREGAQARRLLAIEMGSTALGHVCHQIRAALTSFEVSLKSPPIASRFVDDDMSTMG